MQPWAKRIKELLDEGRERGLSEAGLTRACKAKQPSIWQWFNPKNGKTTKNITAVNAVRAAEYLGTTAEYIVTGRGQRRASQDLELDLTTLQESIVAVKKALRVSGLELDAFVASPMLAFAYRERIKLPRDLGKAELVEFDAVISQRLRGELGNDSEKRPIAHSRQIGDDKVTASPPKARRSRN